jgi:hypothetical protein
MKVQDGVTILVTRLIHESGEFIESEMILPSHPEPQKFGSLITYYKRYQLQALLGVNTEEDDDGNSAVKSSQKEDQTETKVNTSFAEKALEAAVKKGTAELRKAWEKQTEEVRDALKNKLADWKAAAAKQDAEIAVQA